MKELPYTSSCLRRSPANAGGGALKDAAKAAGMTAESAMDGRGDREQLEAKAQEGEVGEMLRKLKGWGPTSKTD